MQYAIGMMTIKKNQDYRPYHERQNETVSCVQVIKFQEKYEGNENS